MARISSELRALVERTVAGLGYELVELERFGHGLLRVSLDTAHPGGIGLDDCEKVSLAVSAILDVEDPLPGHYDLEVSSPGLDRKLTKTEHFHGFSCKPLKMLIFR